MLPARLATILLALLGGFSCATVGDAWMTGWTERAANDQIMLVADHPPTLGCQRLQYQSQVYPDLATFLAARGWPDFLAETTSGQRRYLVLYFLDRRQAFAARTRHPDDRSMEFAGPYPVTRREYELLDRLRRHRPSTPSGAPATR
jgi:hypothetical protein